MPNNKLKIPKSVKDEVWKLHCGKRYTHKCCVKFCSNKITSANFQAGHIQSEAKGGLVTVENLIPICSTCNQSMGTMNLYEWQEKHMADDAACSAINHRTLGSRYKEFKEYENDVSEFKRYKNEKDEFKKYLEKKERKQKSLFNRMKAVL